MKIEYYIIIALVIALLVLWKNYVRVFRFAQIMSYKKGYYESTIKGKREMYSSQEYKLIKKVIDIETNEDLDRHRNFES